MRGFWRNQRGVTLFELVLVIIIMGIALPSLLSLMGQISLHSTRPAILEKAIALTEEKMEEIIGKKEANWDWYKNPNQFVSTELLTEGFQRTVTVTPITGWGNAALDAWEVKVTVTHNLLPNGYSLTVRFTKYH